MHKVAVVPIVIRALAVISDRLKKKRGKVGCEDCNGAYPENITAWNSKDLWVYF